MTASPQDSPTWLRRYLDEYLTLDEVGKLDGITREAVRQRLKSMGIKPRTLEETYLLRERREISLRGADIRKTFLQTRDVSGTAGQLGLSEALVRRALDELVPDFGVLARVPRSGSKKYSAGDLLASLREASDTLPGILTTAGYDSFVEAHPTLLDGRPRPGKQAMMLRFGSWRDALQRAGLPANPRYGPQKEYSEADAVAAVVECWRQTGGAPTSDEYEQWQRDHVARPSGATVRKLAGNWNPLLVRAWQLVHGVILDQDDEDVSVPEPLLPRDGAQSVAVPFASYHGMNEGAEVPLQSDLVEAECNALESDARSHALNQNAVAATAGRELPSGLLDQEVRIELSAGGLRAAISLRAGVLRRLGAEPEWMAGDSGAQLVSWTAGLATTFFEVAAGPADAPGLGVLRVCTPVVNVGDMEVALSRCAALNTGATTSRWLIAPGRYDGEECEQLSIDCSFVVGAHSQEDLESFAAWCVSEQIATAAAQLNGDLAFQLSGTPCIQSVHETAPYRTPAEWNPVVRHYERFFELSEGWSELWERCMDSYHSALHDLQQEMLREGTGAWGWSDGDEGFACNMPATWLKPSGEYIYAEDDPSGQPTVHVTERSSLWEIADGLLITMKAPSYDADSDAVLNELNRLHEGALGATHWIGAWTQDDDGILAYQVFLSARLLELESAVDFVLREILLTLARQAQLARRIVAPDDGPVQPVGFEAPHKPHGLAWGETGEGGRVIPRHLDGIYERLVGGDHRWADLDEHGFTWWPYEQAQRVTVTGYATDGQPGRRGLVRVSTDIRANVPFTDETLTVIAKRNAMLPESALVLGDDGSLVLACQADLLLPLPARGEYLVQDLAIRQFIAARELAAELAGLGTDVVRQHPASGPRPEPDVWFEQYARRLRDAVEESREDWPESRPLVALFATTEQYDPPYRMAVSKDGSLDFSWRPGHPAEEVPVRPEIRVTITPGAEEPDPAWIIRSRLRVAGDEAARARWCNDRNAELLLDPQSSGKVTVIGGWGLAGDGECCLTAGLVRLPVRDDEEAAMRELWCLLLEAAGVVYRALRATPETVRTAPLTAMELVVGLDTVRASFGRLLGTQSDLEWMVRPGNACALLTWGETTMEVPVDCGTLELHAVHEKLISSFPDRPCSRACR